MWFIVKISFVKKKNCPDNLNYYTTNINEATRSVLNLFFFNNKISQVKKAQKECEALKSTKKQFKVHRHKIYQA